MTVIIINRPFAQVPREIHRDKQQLTIPMMIEKSTVPLLRYQVEYATKNIPA